MNYDEIGDILIEIDDKLDEVGDLVLQLPIKPAQAKAILVMISKVYNEIESAAELGATDFD